MLLMVLQLNSMQYALRFLVSILVSMELLASFTSLLRTLEPNPLQLTRLNTEP